MSGNGTDLGHVVAMLQQLIVSQADLANQFQGMKQDVHGLKQDVHGLKQDMRDVKHDLAALKQTVAEYHGAVVGQGIALSEHDFRLGRIETHLGLPPASHT